MKNDQIGNLAENVNDDLHILVVAINKSHDVALGKPVLLVRAKCVQRERVARQKIDIQFAVEAITSDCQMSNFLENLKGASMEDSADRRDDEQRLDAELAKDLLDERVGKIRDHL